MQSVELFSGMGGLAKGLEISGFRHLAFVEYNRDACSSLRSNFSPEKVFEGDIREFDLSTIGATDIVAGGPPCQPFSLAGKHKANNDSRDMFPYAIQAIEKLKPRAFIFENVKGLLRQTFSEYFSYIVLRLSYPDFPINENATWEHNLEALRKIDPARYKGVHYDVNFKLVNAADYGVPQTRERVIIVGIRSDLGKKWTFPKQTHSENRLWWEQFISKEYWKRHKLPEPDISKLNKPLQQRIERMRNAYGIFPPEGTAWRTIRDCLSDVPEPLQEHDIIDHIFKAGAKTYPGHTGSEIDWPSKTIKAGGHGVPGGENMIKFEDDSVRYLTVYEAKLLQTFPKDFVVTGAWGEAMRQIGNAVPVLLAEKLGKHLYSLISEADTKRKAA